MGRAQGGKKVGTGAQPLQPLAGKWESPQSAIQLDAELAKLIQGKSGMSATFGATCQCPASPIVKSKPWVPKATSGTETLEGGGKEWVGTV